MGNAYELATPGHGLATMAAAAVFAKSLVPSAEAFESESYAANLKRKREDDEDGDDTEGRPSNKKVYIAGNSQSAEQTANV